jgi:hypothetical protein
MAHVQVHGRGVTLYLSEIVSEIADELTKSGVSLDRFAEIRQGEDTYAAGISSELEVFVDGEKISVQSDDGEGASVATPIMLEAGKYYLVVQETAEGRWLDIQTEGPFDPAKLSANVGTYVLADGATITLTEVDYDSSSALGGTEVVGEDATVIFPDGSSEDVVLIDDEVGESEEVVMVTATSSTRPPAAKKAPAKGAKAKSLGTKRAGAKKAIVKKSTTKKSAAKKAAIKKGTAKKPAVRKLTTKSATTKRKRRALKK